MPIVTRMLIPVCAALALLAIDTSIAPAQTGKTFTLKFNHVLGPREPYHEGFLAWAKRVAERTNGGLKMDVFPTA